MPWSCFPAPWHYFIMAKYSCQSHWAILQTVCLDAAALLRRIGSKWPRPAAVLLIPACNRPNAALRRQRKPLLSMRSPSSPTPSFHRAPHAIAGLYPAKRSISPAHDSLSRETDQRIAASARNNIPPMEPAQPNARPRIPVPPIPHSELPRRSPAHAPKNQAANRLPVGWRPV